jgi:hypothetical protein
MKYSTRMIVPPPLRRAVKPFSAAVLFSDVVSFANYVLAPHRDGSTMVPLRLRAIGGDALWIRNAGSDHKALYDAFFFHYQDPPADCRSPALILDLGANIGTTMVYFAHRYPAARIVGVEMDPDNARLCRRNIAHLGARCCLIRGSR